MIQYTNQREKQKQQQQLQKLANKQQEINIEFNASEKQNSFVERVEIFNAQNNFANSVYIFFILFYVKNKITVLIVRP
jgi:hypothetical protein